MSVTASTDPVQTVLDILSNAAAGEFSNPNGKPTRITRSSEFAPSDKSAYEAGNALYVYQSGTSGIESLGTDAYTEAYRISTDIWTLNGEPEAHAIARDVQGVLNGYWTDNKTRTAWTTVRPFEIQDYRHETFADFGQHDRLLVEGRVSRNGSL